jgi:hypothetical protein
MPAHQQIHAEPAVRIPSAAQSHVLARSTARRAVAGAILAASMGAALWAGSGSAAAMSFRGGGGFHAGNGGFGGSAYRLPAGRSRVGLIDGRQNGVAARRLGSRLARRPSPGDGEPRHPRRPHRPIIVGFPGGPAGPIATVNMPPSGPGGPPAMAAPGGGAPPGGVPAASARQFIPDEILVRFAADLPSRAIVDFAQAQRLALLGIHRLPLINTVLYRFRITDRRQVPAVIGGLQGDSRIAGIQPNFRYTLRESDAARNTTTGDPAQYVVSTLHLPQAHGFATGNRVLVAVIDSAIDATHPELQGVVAARFDAIGGQPLPDKHGTGMASAIAAHARLLGVAPAAQILAVRAFDASIAGAQSTTVRILDGLQWTATSGARVVNMSFTGPADRKMHEMLAAAHQKGMVLVAAVGNNGPQAPEAFPAAYPEVIAVTATDIDDKLFDGANRGRYVSVAAPGVDIFVAAPNGGYDFTTGTSVATAHVSGLAALLLERDPTLAPDAVQAILMRTAKDLGPAGRDDQYGAGLVDAYEALLALAPATAERTVGH